MARTAGSTSNLVVKFPTLVKAIGQNYQGNITVNRNWFTQTAETNGFRVQVFPAGKKSGTGVAKARPAAKTVKKAKPVKKAKIVKKTNRHQLDKIEVGTHGEVTTV